MFVALLGFGLVFGLLYKPFGLSLDSNAVNQIWHSTFNTLVGPVLTVSVMCFFHQLLSLAKIGKRRVYNTQAYRKMEQKLIAKSDISANGQVTKVKLTADQAALDHYESYTQKGQIHVQVPQKSEFLKSSIYLVLRTIYFEVFMSHLTVLFLRFFSWQVLSNLDPMFINIMMNGNILLCFATGFLLKLFITKPVENLLKCLEILIVDGTLAGYSDLTLLNKFNNTQSTQVFQQTTGPESFFNQLMIEHESVQTGKKEQQDTKYSARNSSGIIKIRGKKNSGGEHSTKVPSNEDESDQNHSSNQSRYSHQCDMKDTLLSLEPASYEEQMKL